MQKNLGNHPDPRRNIPCTVRSHGTLRQLLYVILFFLVFSSDLSNFAFAGTAQHRDFPDTQDQALQQLLTKSLDSLNLTSMLEKNKLSVTLVDITDVDQPALAHINGANTYYAASLPKLAILLAVYEEAHQGNLELDESVQQKLDNMIRKSSNRDSTSLWELVGPVRLAEILRSDRYRLYDEKTGGGLWVGKAYAKNKLWKRDPLANFSHAASGIQAARFFYMLQRGELVNPQYSHEMKNILADSAINHKFVKGLAARQPEAKIYRKSGTWRTYHSDSALIERDDGHTYIAVVLSDTTEGGRLLEKIIVSLDQVIDEYHSR